MGFDAWLTLAVVVITVALLIWTRIAPELVLVTSQTALLLFGVPSAGEALIEMANPGLVTVGVLYVIVAGLVDTGAVHALGARLLGRPKSVVAAQVRLMLPVTAISAFLAEIERAGSLLPAVAPAEVLRAEDRFVFIQTNLMAYGPGGCRFSDFARIGVVLNITLGIVAVMLAPLIWPF